MFHICWRFDAFLFYQKQSHKAYSITLIKSNFFPSPDWNRSSYSINVGGKNAFDILHHISMRITFKTQTNNFWEVFIVKKKHERQSRPSRVAQLGETSITRQKLDFKKSLNWWIIFVPATVWLLKVKHTQWPGIIWIFWNLHGETYEITSWEFVFGWF